MVGGRLPWPENTIEPSRNSENSVRVAAFLQAAVFNKFPEIIGWAIEGQDVVTENIYSKAINIHDNSSNQKLIFHSIRDAGVECRGAMVIQEAAH